MSCESVLGGDECAPRNSGCCTLGRSNPVHRWAGLAPSGPGGGVVARKTAAARGRALLLFELVPEGSVFGADGEDAIFDGHFFAAGAFFIEGPGAQLGGGDGCCGGGGCGD